MVRLKDVWRTNKRGDRYPLGGSPLVNLSTATKPQGLSPKKRLINTFNVPKRKALQALDERKRTDIARKQELESREREAELKESSRKTQLEIDKLIAIENAKRGKDSKGLVRPVDLDELERKKKTLPSQKGFGIGESRNALRTNVTPNLKGSLPKSEQEQDKFLSPTAPPSTPDEKASRTPVGKKTGIFGRLQKTGAEKARDAQEKLEKKARKEEENRLSKAQKDEDKRTRHQLAVETQAEKDRITARQNEIYQQNAQQRKQDIEEEAVQLNMQQQTEQEILAQKYPSHTTLSDVKGLGGKLQ